MPWWHTAVIYQVYPRSFADANGDGIGDLPGLTSRLGHLVDLGVDALWVNPFFRSPQADAGYDVSDHRDVDPLFGTLEDARRLLAQAHRLGLRLIVDLVPNHTSDQHPWFQAALAAPGGSPLRDRYVFRPGRGPGGHLPPNNWESSFGGPAWTRIADGSWYLHLYAPEQPDLNWSHPDVADEFEQIIRFWLDLGVDGLRVDVAHGLVKDPELSDLPPGVAGPVLAPEHAGDHPHWDRDPLHDIYRRWRAVVDEYPDDRVFVAEAYVPNPERFALYVRPDELHTAFNFDFFQAGWDAPEHRRVIEATTAALAGVGAPPTWVLSNHDRPRHATRFGGGPRGRARARAATLLMLALPGSAYLYQGEELGLEDVEDIPGERRQDPTFARTGGEVVGRDGCRVPMPWSGSEEPFGFSPAGAHEPWLPQPAEWAALTVAAQRADPGSTLSFYRAALAARRARPDRVEADLTWVDAPEGMLAFIRGRAGGFACAVNYTDDALNLPAPLRGGALLLSSADDAAGWAGRAGSAGQVRSAGRVPPDTAVWLSLGPASVER